MLDIHSELKSNLLVRSLITLSITMMILIAALSLLLAIGSYLSMPDVKRSYLTDECISVESNNSEYNCGNLPKKYHLIWVK